MANIIVIFAAMILISSFGSSNKESLGFIHSNSAIASSKTKTSHKKVLNRHEALEIAQIHGFKGTGKELYELSKEYFTATSDDSKKSAKESLVNIGLLPAKNDEGKYAWKAK